jgi:methionyl-tRNA synthetase
VTRTLVTSALTYANGPIHFGHIIGANLPADVYVRTLRMQGEQARFVCGTDEYGVAIAIGAEAAGMEPGEYAAKWREQIRTTFDALDIGYDVFSGTSSSPHHAEMSRDFFRALNANGFLIKETSNQLFCEPCDRFLADRYITGTCPKCAHEKARGDECPKCGEWLDPLEIIEPKCGVCGASPQARATTHWYLDLPKLRDEHIGQWFEGKAWKPNVQAFVKELLKGIDKRPITRDMKWGIPLPEEIAGDEEGKVLYVWFDAPIGYISFLREWAEQQGSPDEWEDWWKSEDTELVHFMGKDNIPFHCIVFPSMLYGVKQDYILPSAVPAMEFYNLEGAKFNTTEGRVIPLEPFFEKYDSDATRFYLLSSAPETSDSDWRWEDFQTCVNAGLADTIGNLATRVLRFVDKHFDGKVPALAPGHEAELDKVMLAHSGPIADPAESIRRFRYREATQQLLNNAAVANVYIDTTAPWSLRKTDMERCGSVLNTAVEWLHYLARWMAPFMPNKSQALWEMLGQAGPVAEAGWPTDPVAGNWRNNLGGQELGEIQGLFNKIDSADIAAEREKLS